MNGERIKLEITLNADIFNKLSVLNEKESYSNCIGRLISEEFDKRELLSSDNKDIYDPMDLIDDIDDFYDELQSRYHLGDSEIEFLKRKGDSVE